MVMTTLYSDTVNSLRGYWEYIKNYVIITYNQYYPPPPIQKVCILVNSDKQVVTDNLGNSVFLE